MRSTAREERPVRISAHQPEAGVADVEAQLRRFHLLQVQRPAHRRQVVRLLQALEARVVEAAAGAAEVMDRQVVRLEVVAVPPRLAAPLPHPAVAAVVDAAPPPTRSNSSALSWIPAPRWLATIASTR
jgi:hypothetical protein